jgi:hypothetical protein
MARARRAWSTIRDEVRTLLRETTAADSYWSDAELLIYANLCQDIRATQMLEAHEGWFTDRFEDDLVANQGEYTLPEGTDRVKRVLLKWSDTGLEVPLIRNERWSDSVTNNAGGSVAVLGGTLPTYRLVGEVLLLEPAPTEARTDGLVAEIESLPARITGDASKFDLKYPSMFETLITFDIWDMALGVEDAQGNVDTTVRGRLQTLHAKMEHAFSEAIQQRSFGRTFGRPYNLGD